MPSKSPGITKNPSYGHLVFILFSQVLKKASAQPPTKLRSTHSTQQLIHFIHSTTPTVSFIRSTSTTTFIPCIQLRSFHSLCFTRSTASSGSTRFARSFHSLRCIHYIHLLFPFHSLTRRRFRFIHSVHDLFRFIRLTRSPRLEQHPIEGQMKL